ncbi:MAG: hypothetical protein D6685_01980 [Bacteroidetes bacterium]|nr:MAG: hypothetical protein D6685_01980 [Bacteroidota bacterium]
MRFVFLSLALVLLLAGCQPSASIEGRRLAIDYPDDAEIGEEAWIRIDEYLFEHTCDARAGDTLRYPLPCTYTVFDSAGERTFGSRIDPRAVALHLAQHLQAINAGRPDSVRYVIGNPALISLEARLLLSRADSARITVTTSEGYPARIGVLR